MYLVRFVIDKLRVAGVMKKKNTEASSLSYCSFVSHKDPPSLVTLKSEKVWLLAKTEKI